MLHVLPSRVRIIVPVLWISGMSSLFAATSQWIAGSGQWDAEQNWSGGVPDESTSLTIIGSNGSANIGSRVAANAGESLMIGPANSGSVYILEGGSLKSGSAVLGAESGGKGTVYVGGVWNTDSLEIGESGEGYVYLHSGGELSVGDGQGTIHIVSGIGVGNAGVLTIGARSGMQPLPSGKLSAAAIEFGKTSGSLLFNHNDNFILASNVSGTGQVQLLGTGTVVVTGNLSHTGGTAIGSNATLKIGNGGSSGWITGKIENSGNLVFDRSDDIVFTNTVTGAGGRITKVGENKLTLLGAKIDSTLYVEEGTLQIGNGGSLPSLTGSVINSAHLVVNHSGTFVYENGISGNGDFTKLGSGTFVMKNGKYGTGTMTIAEGAVEIAGFGGLNGSVINDGELIFNREMDYSYYAGISGSGGLTKRGDYRLLLSGENTYTGLTKVEGGTLQIGQGGLGGSIAGDIENNATVVISRANPWTYAGAISGTGNLVKNGTGVLTLTGANTYSGGTVLEAGTLSASNQALGTGELEIVGGALAVAGVGFTGALQIGGLELGNAGTIAFDLNGLANYDQLTISGDFQLEGGTLRINLIGGFTPKAGNEFDLFDWSGSASGEFSNYDLPALQDGLAWDTSSLLETGVLRVVAVPEPHLLGLFFFGLGALVFWKNRNGRTL